MDNDQNSPTAPARSGRATGSPTDTMPACDCADWGMTGCLPRCAQRRWLERNPAPLLREPYEKSENKG